MKRHGTIHVAPILLALLPAYACKSNSTLSTLRDNGAQPAAQGHMYDDFKGGVWATETCQRANKAVRGQRQSPISIDADKYKAVDGDTGKVVLSHEKSKVTIVDNGHTIQVNYPADYIAGGKGVLKHGGEEYFLHQFHFHSRSEHVLKDKAASEMEVHFVHKNKAGNKAVALGFFIDKGENDNAALAGAWGELQKYADKKKKEKEDKDKEKEKKDDGGGAAGGAASGQDSPSDLPAVVGGNGTGGTSNDTVEPVYDEFFGLSGHEESVGALDELDATAFMQGAVGGGYYTYEGSLTTPPCAEIVTHLVSLKPILLSKAQIDLFRQFHEKSARELQAAGEDEVRKYRLVKE